MQRNINIFLGLLSVFAGILFTLAFAPFNFSYLAPLALCLLFTAWHNTSPQQALLRGYLFGFGSFGLGVSWVYISIHDFGGSSPLIAASLTFLFVGFWALFPALAGYLSVKIQLLNNRNRSYLTSPVVWMLVEYLRGNLVLNGFPWLQSAYSQLDTPLASYIPVVGGYGTGFLVALTASGLLAIVQKPRCRYFLMCALLSIWGTGSYLQSLSWTQAVGEPIKVSLLQGNITQDQKWRPENKLNTLRWYQTMTEAHWDSAIIVWPETSIPAYLSDVNDWFLRPLSQAAEEHQTSIIVSLPINNTETNEKYNAVMTLGKDTGNYKKTHLLPFGEYLPWQPISGLILNNLGMRLGLFTEGAIDQPLLKAAGYPFITTICYEDAFDELALNQLSAAAFLINVTNDGWFGQSIEPHQHLQIARMRALETGRYLLRATNTGATAIVDPKGKILRQAPLFEATVLTDRIIPMQGLTPYAHLGEKPVLIFLMILFLTLLLPNSLFSYLVKNKPEN